MKPLIPLFEKNKTIYEIIGFDVETHGSTNQFFMGGLYGKQFTAYYSREEMIRGLLTPKNNGKLLVATNLMFDFTAVFYNTKYWDKFKIIYSGSKLLCAIYENAQTKITFLDTGNYLPLSVAQMGDILKIPKLEKPVCLGRLPNNNEEQEELEIYNKRDCEISKKFLELIQTTVNALGGKLKITIASCSMDVYRRKYHRFFMKHEPEVLEQPKFYDFIFDAYFGGRCEIYSRGRITNAKVYDINSLYPHVMQKEYPFPPSVRQVQDANNNISFSLKFMGVSKVRVTSPKTMKYPYLPKKHKVGGSTKLLFPLGTWTGTYTHFELNRAIELGYTIDEAFTTYIYRSSYFPFRNYVRDLYDLRLKFKKEKSNMELGVKLLMNSLYGKFAQRYVKDTYFINIDTMTDEEIDDFMTNPDRKITMNKGNCGIETVEKECDSSFVFPIFPVYVTAYARDLLYNYIIKHNALYCDTDSITTRDILTETTALGGMKEEYNVKEGIYIKPKMYMVDTGEFVKVKIKGLPIRTKEVFMQLLNGEAVAYQKFTKLKESVKRGMLPNTIVQTQKLMLLEDNKRVWKGLFDSEVLQESIPITVNE